MNTIARRLLVSVVRKLLPEALPDNPGSALALRPPIGELMPVDRRRSQDDFLPTVRPSQALYCPPPPDWKAAPAPPPRRRKVTITETVFVERDGGFYD